MTKTWLRWIAAVVGFFCFAGCASVAVLGLFLSWETARRNECSNNLKQMGLAMHNHHDTLRVLPPLSAGPGRASYFVSIMPYAESSNNYSLLSGVNASENTSLAEHMHANWGLLNPDERRSIASTAYMTCPSRRGGTQMRESGAGSGPLGDYAAVFAPDVRRNHQEYKATEDWFQCYDPCDYRAVQRNYGVLRAAVIDCAQPEPERYKVARGRDSINRMVDGTSNTAVIGEKYVRPSEFGKCCGENQTDGSYLYMDDNWREFSVLRNIALPFGSSSGGSPRDDFGFGGPHGAVTLFGMGDGSVRPLHHSLPQQLRMELGCASDGLDLSRWNDTLNNP